MKIIVALVLLLGGSAAAWLVPWSDLDGEAQAAAFGEDVIFRAKRGALDITVSENGHLKAKNEEKIKPQFKREGIITWLIEEGNTVEEGELLVEFDKTDLESDIADEENKLIQYEVELEAAKAQLAIQERDNAASIEKAELKHEIAKLNLERYTKGEGPNELRKKELALEKAQSAYKRKLDDFEKVPALEAEGFLTPNQVEEERIALREAEINQENAEKELELHVAYSAQIDQTQKETDVRDAERELENAREKATINLNQKKAALTSAERKVVKVNERLEELKEELGYMSISAPQPGVVHFGDSRRWWSNDDIKVGGRVHRGNTVITLPDLSEMLVVLEIHEADIDQVKMDMVADISIDAVKGEHFTGKVSKIASVASSEGWRGGTGKTFEVEITLDPFEQELRAGITAKADIKIQTLDDVLYVPIHAIYAESGEHFCFVVVEGGYERKVVEIGRNNTHHVEVASGLEEDDAVLLYDPRVTGTGSGSGADVTPDEVEDDSSADEGGE